MITRCPVAAPFPVPPGISTAGVPQRREVRLGAGGFPPLCPPFFLLWGYPGGAKLVSGRHFADDRLRDDLE